MFWLSFHTFPLKPEVRKLTFTIFPSDHDGIGCHDTPQMDTQFYVVGYVTIISPELPALHNNSVCCVMLVQFTSTKRKCGTEIRSIPKVIITKTRIVRQLEVKKTLWLHSPIA